MRTVRTDIPVNMLVIFVILVNRYGPHTVMIAILAGTVVVIMTVVVVMLVVAVIQVVVVMMEMVVTLVMILMT